MLNYAKLGLIFGLLAASCTFGGGEGDPTGGYKGSDAGPAIDAATIDASALIDASPRSDSGAAPRDAALAVDAAPQAEMCTPGKPVAVCDPVKNAGCTFSQCEIDPAATMSSGRCVIRTLQLGGSCSSDGISTTCDATNSCVDGNCRKTCYCTADCGDPGLCCQGAAPGPAGPVKLCEPC